MAEIVGHYSRIRLQLLQYQCHQILLRSLVLGEVNRGVLLWKAVNLVLVFCGRTLGTIGL